MVVAPSIMSRLSGVARNSGGSRLSREGNRNSNAARNSATSKSIGARNSAVVRSSGVERNSQSQRTAKGLANGFGLRSLGWRNSTSDSLKSSDRRSHGESEVAGHVREEHQGTSLPAAHTLPPPPAGVTKRAASRKGGLGISALLAKFDVGSDTTGNMDATRSREQQFAGRRPLQTKI